MSREGAAPTNRNGDELLDTDWVVSSTSINNKVAWFEKKVVQVIGVVQRVKESETVCQKGAKLEGVKLWRKRSEAIAIEDEISIHKSIIPSHANRLEKELLENNA